jgi:hypothetical protein
MLELKTTGPFACCEYGCVRVEPPHPPGSPFRRSSSEISVRCGQRRVSSAMSSSFVRCDREPSSRGAEFPEATNAGVGDDFAVRGRACSTRERRRGGRTSTRRNAPRRAAASRLKSASASRRRDTSCGCRAAVVRCHHGAEFPARPRCARPGNCEDVLNTNQPFFMPGSGHDFWWRSQLGPCLPDVAAVARRLAPCSQTCRP